MTTMSIKEHAGDSEKSNDSRGSSVASKNHGNAVQEPSTEKTAPADEPPDGGYGWVIVACTAAINAHTWGINSSYGVFLAYYLANDYYAGASALEYAFVGGLSISQALMISPLATTITRVFGTRYTLLCGVFLETLALIGASFTHQIWQLFLSQGICFGFGMGFLFVGSVGIPPQWFTKRRSLANGICTAGSGIGGMMYSLATNAMIDSLGVEWALRILGILCCGVNFICAMLMRDRNKAIGASQLAFDHTLFRRLEYWLLLGWGFFSMMGYIVLLFTLPSYATSIGLTAEQGSIVGALLNLGQGLGRPVVGIFSDSAGRINLATVCTFLAGVLSLAIWIPAKSYGVLIFYALAVGTVAGTFWTTIGPVGAEVVGLQELPSALSIVWLFLVLPSTFAEPVALEMRTQTGDIYQHSQIFTGFMYIGAALCTLILRAWKIGQMEALAAEEGKADAVPSTTDQSHIRRTISAASKQRQSSFLKRIFRWKNV